MGTFGKAITGGADDPVLVPYSNKSGENCVAMLFAKSGCVLHAEEDATLHQEGWRTPAGNAASQRCTAGPSCKYIATSSGQPHNPVKIFAPPFPIQGHHV